MNTKVKKTTSSDNKIAVNRKALHDYFIEERFEAGIALDGWEVKSLRAGRLQINESYVVFTKGEAYILNSHISPLESASTHVDPNATRSRKLLLHKKELSKLYGSIERKGYTLIPLAMYWKNGKVKVEIGLAKGKKQHDKRQTSKERDWNRDKARILKHYK